ncbi:uncharacterized protein [Rutidosis leptorrhynchoides]|uniref:uncharacterized protein n=1 Tax=Rutidosis leptorrhynchoides TaxID=125765 RepID=UPI003A9A19B9
MGKQKRKWTNEEEEALKSGIKKHGVGKWRLILNDPRFASSLSNRNNIDIKDKWRNLLKYGDRETYVKHPPPSSSNRSKKVPIEEISDPKDNHNRCTVICKRRKTPNDTANETSKTKLVKDLYESEDYKNPCTITRKKSGTRSTRVTKGSRKGVVEEVNDSHDYLNPCNVTRKKSGSRSMRVNQGSKKDVVEEVNDSRDYRNPCTITPQRFGNCKKNISQDCISRKMSSEIVQNYLGNLWLNFSEDKKSAFTYLDPLWYVLYSDDSNKEKVLRWIKKKDVFSRRYVFFPIVYGGHWMVIILCHLGGSLGSTTNTPCILLLDSMAKTDHSSRLEPMIKKFVLNIYEKSGRTEDPKLLRKMPFLVPKIPQQRDSEECGVFVLYYITLFVKNAPESFNISDGYPYFMKKDWFNFEELDNFRETLDSISKNVSI